MAAEKILIIDDDEQTVELMRLNLEAEGYKVITALTGELGIAAALADDPDLIILDILLPDFDGWQVIKRLKSERKTMYTPVIMLTALRKPQHVVMGLDHGADDYLSKPFDMREFLARVKVVLSRAGKALVIDPLTGIPGKLKIYEETRKRLEQRNKFFAFVYIDISNLRLVNELYGIHAGDNLIKAVAEILCDITIETREFIGYAGEDDFVVLTIPARVDQIFNALVDKFDRRLAILCPDLKREIEKRGEKLVKIAMSVVSNEERQFGDPLQVKNIALEILKRAKSDPQHSCVNLKDHPL